MDVSRWAIDLNLTPADRRRLEDLVGISGNGNTPQKLVPRARIALLSDGTRLNGAITRDVGVSLPTVHRWQRRIQAKGLNGLLRDKTRPSRIPTLAPQAMALPFETLTAPPSPARRITPLTILRDISPSLARYQGLGFTPVDTDDPGCVGLRAGNTYLILCTLAFMNGDFQAESIAPLLGRTIPYVWVDSVDTAKLAFARMVDRGGHLSRRNPGSTGRGWRGMVHSG